MTVSYDQAETFEPRESIKRTTMANGLVLFIPLAALTWVIITLVAGALGLPLPWLFGVILGGPFLAALHSARGKKLEVEIDGMTLTLDARGIAQKNPVATRFVSWEELRGARMVKPVVGMSTNGPLRRRARAGVVAIVATVGGMLTLAVPSTHALPQPSFAGAPIDPYAPYQGQTTCEPTPKPGVVDFQDILLLDYPGRDLGISRDCSVGGRSEHKEGRALDFAFNVNDPTQAAQANTVLDWLLATDAAGNPHAFMRRFGIMYIIWNRRIFRASNPGAGWQPYSGTSPHTDHIHFSFAWNGARKQTSWWGLDPTSPEATSGQRWVYARGVNDEIYSDYFNGSAWTGFTRLAPGAVFNGEPVVAMSYPRQWVYARGVNNEIYSNAWNGSAWTGFTRLAPGSVFKGDPKVIVSGSQQWVYARGVNDEIYSDHFNGSAWTGFTRLAPGSVFNGDPNGL